MADKTQAPREFYQAGQLDQAIEAITQLVKAEPSESSHRRFLFELLLFAGNLERADAQLDSLVKIDVKSELVVMLMRHLLRAEQARQQFYTDGRVPDVLEEPPEWMQCYLRASVALRENNQEETAQQLRQAEELRPKVTGRCNDHPFEDFRDLDDLNGGFLEVLGSNGKYFWVPFARIRSLEFEKPARPLDLYWRKAQISVNRGPEGEVYVPALYFGSATQEDPRIRLGRATDWLEAPTGYARGVGQREFLVGNEAKSIMQIETLEFDVPDDEVADELQPGDGESQSENGSLPDATA